MNEIDNIRRATVTTIAAPFQFLNGLAINGGRILGQGLDFNGDGKINFSDVGAGVSAAGRAVTGAARTAVEPVARAARGLDPSPSSSPVVPLAAVVAAGAAGYFIFKRLK
ncbi:MAG: hypothetical protein AAFW83_10410 [Pseudomonadota bacterium]